LQTLNPSPQKIQPKLLSELCADYIEKEKKKFLATYENLSNDDANTSIRPIFYQTDAYKNATSVENNELEQYWKRRILFENTPRGNIIMHYDAYKLGFTYYSDISGLPYSLLNAVAMKYVRIYKCRDFFMDTHITPESSPSPFIVRSKDKEENDNTSKETSTTSEKMTIPKSKAFAKLKQYNTVSSKILENNTEVSNSSKNISNIMISMGKISNFSFIPKEKKQANTKATTTTKPLSYNDYKRQFNDFINNK
jgi:electron transfer flavoprotein alpha subunit